MLSARGCLLISSHNIFVIFSVPFPAEEKSNRAALMGISKENNIKVRQHFRLGSTGMDLTKVWFFWIKTEMPWRRHRTDCIVRGESERSGSDLEYILLFRMKGNAVKVRKKQAMGLSTPQKNLLEAHWKTAIITFIGSLTGTEAAGKNTEYIWSNIRIPLACSRDGLDLLFWHHNYLGADLSSTLYEIWQCSLIKHSFLQSEKVVKPFCFVSWWVANQTSLY